MLRVRGYDGRMSRRSRSLVQRVREHIVFSVVAIGVLFIVLRLVGVRSTFAGFVLSVGITLALNIGLSYYNDYRARSPRRSAPSPGGGDIRWREDDAPSGGNARSGGGVRERVHLPTREDELRRREEDLHHRELELRRREERGRENRR